MSGPTTVVFIDYQNAHHSAHRLWCKHGEPMEKCVIHPVLLAETVSAMRAPGADLQGVKVYRGRPNPNKQRTMTSANDQQKMHWETDKRCRVIRRPLSYPDDWGQPGCYEEAREKGIDVQLAVDMVRMAIAGEFEVGILFSRDTDLKPALEAIRELKGPHVEVATWEGSSRLRLDAGKPLWCHKLDEQDFRAVIDRKRYV